MLFDKICDRKCGCGYSPTELYNYLTICALSKNKLIKKLKRALELRKGEEVKKYLVEYLIDCECSQTLTDYVNSVDWLSEEKETD